MTTRMAHVTARDDAKARPKGAEVIPAILTAATELFAERGPEATSIRDIAARAGVNHGLVFRHFGTKERLVGSVLDTLAQQLYELISNDAPEDEIHTAIDVHSRVMARATLDGYAAGELQTSFPGIGLLINDIRDHHPTELDARIAAANIVALQLSWRLFGPYLSASAGLDDMTPQQLHEAIGAACTRLGAVKAPAHEKASRSRRKSS